jgi:hypothetical protein
MYSFLSYGGIYILFNLANLAYLYTFLKLSCLTLLPSAIKTLWHNRLPLIRRPSRTLLSMMRFSILIGVLLLSSEVYANAPSIPYEVLFFYNCYKAEFVAPFLQINELLARVAKNVSVPGNASPDIPAAGVAAEAAIAAQGLTGIWTNDDFARHIVSKKNRSVLLWTKTAVL